MEQIDTLKNHLNKRPLITFFLQHYPTNFSSSTENDEDLDSVYCLKQKLNINKDGLPLICGARTKTPPTICTTPGHTLPSGYTQSGKWKTTKYVPAKTDKRAGK